MSVQVLVDWQNLFKSCERLGLSLDAVLEQIADWAKERGGIFDIRLFTPTWQFDTEPWRTLNSVMIKHGATGELCSVLREGDESFKDVVDFSMLLWVTKWIRHGQEPSHIVFISGDGDLIMAYNEAKRRAENVEFWIVDPGSTSRAILTSTNTRMIKAEKPVALLGTEPNPVMETMLKALKGENLTAEEKAQLKLVKAVARGLANFPINTTPEAAKNSAVRLAAYILGADETDISDVVRALLVTGAASIYSAGGCEIRIDSSSLLLQTLENSGE